MSNKKDQIKEELKEEIKDEIKEELKKELIQEEIVEDIVIDEKCTSEKPRKKTGLYILLIILILISVLLFASPTLIEKYNKDKFSNNIKKETQEEKKEEPNEQSEGKDETIIPEDSTQKSTIEEIFNKLYITESELYSTTTYDVSQMSNHDLIANAIRTLDQGVVVSACIFDQERKFINFTEFNKNFKNLIENREITIDTINSLQQGSSYPSAHYEVVDVGIELSESKEQLKFYGSCGSVFSGEDYTTRKIIDIKEDEQNIYVYVKPVFIKTIEDTANGMVQEYYADYFKKNPANETVTSGEEPSWELYDTYKYTFEKHDNGYYFRKVEKI